MRVIFNLLISLLLLTFGSSLVYACSCGELSQRQRFRASNAVFLGEVIEYKERPYLETDKLKGYPFQVTFKVERQWKGKRQSQITALADFDMVGMCGDLDLNVGQRLLIYAPREHGQLVIIRDCGPNEYAEYAKDEIKSLNNFLFRTYTFFYPFPKF